mmetsp:Transcript_4692/g.7097  ORF Transcript_4692/g.7097 Transcript_4692/m.7097 type:complete len:128 (-) Transcript_4692:44-427(-)|eukprot:CAMPEP_0170499426 /NCGR_PEP_ID=MMETSP0208-20121228/31370_1 /TAXON_ID=197538 /ORGANISM="Strombidium inclinatum, Strain S3" /LENGTH=127 /DNA_ID=CAMNT_0010776965 /DNA_START=416 /DNA_END=799 /DNA_ORIENTATION=+
MRLLVHYVGDVHQPLHTTSMVNKENPRGDYGGNGFRLHSKKGVKNLHSAWDSVLFEFGGYPRLPMNAYSWNQLGDDADRLVKKHHISKKQAEDLDVNTWVAESHLIATKFVYKGVNEWKELPPWYIK